MSTRGIERLCICLLAGLAWMGCSNGPANSPAARGGNTTGGADADASAKDASSNASVDARSLRTDVAPGEVADAASAGSRTDARIVADAGRDATPDVPAAPSDARLDVAGEVAPNPPVEVASCGEALQPIYTSEPNELIPGADDLAWKNGTLFVGHSAATYSWVFSIPDRGGSKNLLYEGHVRRWWLEDDRLIYAQDYELFSMPQTGGPPTSMFRYAGSPAADKSVSAWLDGQVLDRTALYWLHHTDIYTDKTTIRRHLRSGGDDSVLATFQSAPSVRQPVTWAHSAKDSLVFKFSSSFGTYFGALSKTTGTLAELPAPAKTSDLLATSATGRLLWATQQNDWTAQTGTIWRFALSVADVEHTTPVPFAVLPGQVGTAWAAGSGAWYVTTGEADAQGQFHLSIWYVEENGQARRLACDTQGRVPKPNSNGLYTGWFPPGAATAGVAADGALYVAVSYPEGNWGVARIDNPGARANGPATGEPIDGGVSGNDAGNGCPVITHNGGAAGFTEFAVPTAKSGPQTLIKGPDGNLWFTELHSDKLAKITPAGCVTEYPMDSGISELASGPDGNVWFTKPSGQVGRVATDGMLLREWHVAPMTTPRHLAVGLDGNLWFTDDVFLIGRVTPKGVITTFHTAGSPLYMAAGSDGLVWFGESNPSRLGVMNPATEAISEVAIPNNGTAGILALGPDQNIWFLNSRSGGTWLTRINSDRTFTDFAFPSGKTPMAMTSDRDGNLWIAEHEGNAIARFSTSTGDLKEFPIPTPSGEPSGIAVGPDGAIWFTEFTANQIGRFVP